LRNIKTKANPKAVGAIRIRILQTKIKTMNLGGSILGSALRMVKEFDSIHLRLLNILNLKLMKMMNLVDLVDWIMWFVRRIVKELDLIWL
jgi:hypothetical protein